MQIFLHACVYLNIQNNYTHIYIM